MTAAPSFSWRELSRAREEVRLRYPRVSSLPVVRRRFPFLASFLRDGGHLLEVGAAERPFDARLKATFPALVHRTLDIDPEGTHDFRSLEEIQETFDCVLAWEVIEHLPMEEIPGWLAGLRRVLAPGGRLIVSTPNVFRPGQYWKDASHRTSLAYAELGALLALSGFEVVSLHRTYHGSWLQYALVRWSPPGLLLPLWDLDFAQSVVAVAQPR